MGPVGSTYHVAATHPFWAARLSLLSDSLKILPRRLDGTTAGCSFILLPLRVPPQAQKCLHTRRFGTLASPPPPVQDLAWGPISPGHLAEELVDEGGSRSASRAHEHDSSQLMSQQKMAIRKL